MSTVVKTMPPITRIALAPSGRPSNIGRTPASTVGTFGVGVTDSLVFASLGSDSGAGGGTRSIRGRPAAARNSAAYDDGETGIASDVGDTIAIASQFKGIPRVSVLKIVNSRQVSGYWQDYNDKTEGKEVWTEQ